ncbi:MAG: hypothetical protein QM729_14645 [Solirubrobacterales bacterium]
MHSPSRSLVAALTVSALGLLVAAPASAAVSATAAPIGSASSGDYLVKIVNGTGEKASGSLIELAGGEVPTGLVPTGCVYGRPVAGWVIGCPAIEAGATQEVCYHGPAAVQVSLFLETFTRVPVTAVGAVSSCPLAGFDASGGVAKLGKVAYDEGKGTATLTVNVPGAGSLKLSGTGVKPVTKKATKVGALELGVKASGQAAQKLASTGSVKLHVVVTFTPSGGAATKLKKTVELKRRAKAASLSLPSPGIDLAAGSKKKPAPSLQAIGFGINQLFVAKGTTVKSERLCDDIVGSDSPIGPPQQVYLAAYVRAISIPKKAATQIKDTLPYGAEELASPTFTDPVPFTRIFGFGSLPFGAPPDTKNAFYMPIVSYSAEAGEYEGPSAEEFDGEYALTVRTRFGGRTLTSSAKVEIDCPRLR